MKVHTSTMVHLKRSVLARHLTSIISTPFKSEEGREGEGVRGWGSPVKIGITYLTDSMFEVRVDPKSMPSVLAT